MTTVSAPLHAPARLSPPFRADVVGSFLRPAKLKAAREALLGPQTPDQHLGPHDNAALRAVEDECVREVVAMQGDVRLAADTLTLALAADSTNGLRTVVAEGNVRFSKGDRRASARRAEYDQAKRMIVLDQDAVLEDSRGNVSGDRVSVYLDEGRTVVEGGEGRVRAVLRPAEDGKGDEDAKAAHAGAAGEGVAP